MQTTLIVFAANLLRSIQCVETDLMQCFEFWLQCFVAKSVLWFLVSTFVLKMVLVSKNEWYEGRNGPQRRESLHQLHHYGKSQCSREHFELVLFVGQKPLRSGILSTPPHIAENINTATKMAKTKPTCPLESGRVSSSTFVHLLSGLFSWSLFICWTLCFRGNWNSQSRNQTENWETKRTNHKPKTGRKNKGNQKLGENETSKAY